MIVFIERRISFSRRGEVVEQRDGSTTHCLLSLPENSTPQVLPAYSSYKYQGCFSDSSTLGRALPISLSPTKKTIGACILLAKLKGYKFAGVEWGGECWAAKALASTSKPISYEACDMVCEDSPRQICGGSRALTLYKA